MPLLGIIAMALTKNDNPNALADPVHPNFAKIIVMLGVTSKLFHGDKRVYRCCLFFTTIFALLDGLKAAGIKLSALETILGNTIPLYADGFGWIVPSVCGALLGLLWKLLVPAQTK